MADGLLGVLRHQRLEFGLGALMVEKGRARRAEQPGEFRPGVRLAHVDDPDGLDPRPRRLDAVGSWGLAGLHAAPEPPLGGDEEVLIERHRRGWSISTHLPPPVMIDSAADCALVTHMLCCSWAMCFSAAASSENDQGSMNLASNTASRSLTKPSRVAAIQRMHRVPDPALDVGHRPSGVAFVPASVQRLGSDAKLDDEIAATGPPARLRRAFPSTAGSAPPRPGS